MGMKPEQEYLAGAGPDFWDACLIWLWPHVPGAPMRLAPDHCRHAPRVGDDAYPASSQAGLRPPSHCTCPGTPSDVRLGHLSPGLPQSTHKGLPYRILRRMSRISPTAPLEARP